MVPFSGHCFLPQTVGTCVDAASRHMAHRAVYVSTEEALNDRDTLRKCHIVTIPTSSYDLPCVNHIQTILRPLVGRLGLLTGARS